MARTVPAVDAETRGWTSGFATIRIFERVRQDANNGWDDWEEKIINDHHGVIIIIDDNIITCNLVAFVFLISS